MTSNILNILVAGGAGYIGSHMVHYLQDHGHRVTVLDNLSTGHRELIGHCPLIIGDIGNADLLESLFKQNSFDAVMHFAALSQVAESFQKPFEYYQNNVTQVLTLLEKMITHHIPYFVFSSTAAIFGHPETIPIPENAPANPINPYGQTKLTIEKLLVNLDERYGLKSTCLRYFNAAGADPNHRTGECHQPESHLIPLVLQAALGQRDTITIFGDQHPTADGTAIRDYVHVMDLAQAHLLALQKMMSSHQSSYYNLGNGNGYSVKQIIDAAQIVTGTKIPRKIGPQRQGDPAILIADPSKAFLQLNWQPQYDQLETIIYHAWEWAKIYADFDHLSRKRSTRVARRVRVFEIASSKEKDL